MRKARFGGFVTAMLLVGIMSGIVVTKAAYDGNATAIVRYVGGEVKDGIQWVGDRVLEFMRHTSEDLPDGGNLTVRG